MPAAIARAAQPAVLFGFKAGACVVVAGALVVVAGALVVVGGALVVVGAVVGSDVVGSDVVVGALGV